MLNFKIENATDKFLEMVGGKWNYKFKGETFEVTPESLSKYSREMQQSFGAFAAKNLSRKPPRAQFVDELTIGRTYIPRKVESKKLSKVEKVRKELIRLAKTEKIVEEKLNYPKVFQALLTEPHTAFEHKKKTIEEHFNLTLIIDTNVGYMNRGYMGKDVEAGLPATIIEAAKNIKGITVFASGGLHLIEYKHRKYDYYTTLLKDLPKHMTKNVIVFTQGCGGMGHYQGIKPEAVKFVTPFEYGCNCGCEQIKKAANAGQIMYYGINCADKLKEIK